MTEVFLGLSSAERGEALEAGAYNSGLRVATHKSWFFREKDAQGNVIDYKGAVTGALRLVPEGDAREMLAEDYALMDSAGLLPVDPPSFDYVMARCREIEQRANE